MTVEPVGIVAFVVGILCLFGGPIASVYALIFASLLQSASAFMLTSLGGASVQPGHLLLVVLVPALIRQPSVLKATLRAAVPPAPGFWLVVLVIYAVISSVIMPRLFSGLTYTFGNVRDGSSTGVTLLPLMPNSGNLTQTVYFAGNIVCFLLIVGFASDERRVKAIVNGLLVACGLNLVLAALDLGTYMTGTAELLQPIRNASYRMLDDGEVMGLKRIVGSFPEASTYAFVTLGLFGFSLSLWLRHYKPRVSGGLAICLLSSLMLSTSSTAYAGSIGYIGIVYLASFVRFLRGTASRNMARFVLAAPALFIAFVMLLRFSDGAWRGAGDVLDDFLFNKLNTPSGIERSMWNRQAVQNLFDTYGLGAGLGSVKSSSFTTSVLGNTGVIGAVCFIMFFISMTLKNAKQSSSAEDGPLRQAVSSGCIAFVLSASISGGAIDLGLLFCVMSGVACGTNRPSATTELDCVDRSSGEIVRLRRPVRDYVHGI